MEVGVHASPPTYIFTLAMRGFASDLLPGDTWHERQHDRGFFFREYFIDPKKYRWCHSRESGNPFGLSKSTWIPAFAGMTSG
jgi:hypothetical protein